MKTIRLKYAVRVGHQIHSPNAVFDASDEVADKLLTSEPPCAEETDAIERSPVGNPLTHVDDFPLVGGEKFPLDPEREVIVPLAQTSHIDRLITKRIAAAEPTVEQMSKEPVSAKIDESTIDRKRDERERKDAETAAAAEAIPVKVVKDKH